MLLFLSCLPLAFFFLLVVPGALRDVVESLRLAAHMTSKQEEAMEALRWLREEFTSQDPQLVRFPSSSFSSSCLSPFCPALSIPQ